MRRVGLFLFPSRSPEWAPCAILSPKGDGRVSDAWFYALSILTSAADRRMSEEEYRAMVPPDVINDLSKMEYITFTAPIWSACAFHLTPKGFNAYSSEKQIRDERAKQDAEKDHEALRAQREKKQDRVHDFVVAAFGAALALLAEHFFEIFQFIKQLANR